MSLAARRAASQLLDRPGPRVADTVRHLLGVQAQDARFAALALRARIAGLTRRDIERARVDERSIVRTWAMRGTLHLIAAEDLGWLLPLVAPPRIAQARTRLAALGVTDPERAIALMEGALALEGPLDRHELTERVARGGIVLEGQARIGTIYLAALQGRFCCGPGDTFVLVGDWLPEDARRPLDRDAALRELARRYVAAHAPCAPEDLASLGGHRRCATRGGRGRSTCRSPTPRRPGLVRLLPSFDEWLLGWRSREFTLPPEHAAEVFPGGGWLHPVVVHDGRVAGTWRGGEPQLWDDVPADALEAELADVARFTA